MSLTLTGLTTCLIDTGLHSEGELGCWVVCSCEVEANDLHWAKSTLTQRALVFVICSIAGDTWLLQPKSQAIPDSILPRTS